MEKPDGWDEFEKKVQELPSYVYFADEQDTRRSLLFGGLLIHREKLHLLDEGMAEAKSSVGLPANAPIKWSPPNSHEYAAQRALDPKQRPLLREKVLALLAGLECTCFFSMSWKFDPGYTSECYKSNFKYVLQRLSITMERSVRRTGAVWYPALDVVVDWFPQPQRCKEYFAIYHEAYHSGYSFARNKLLPLKTHGACPCLLVTSCQFSPALQLTDFCVGSMGTLLRWAYEKHIQVGRVKEIVTPVVKHLLRINHKVIGYGLVLPTTGAARRKVSDALAELGVL